MKCDSIVSIKLNNIESFFELMNLVLFNNAITRQIKISIIIFMVCLFEDIYSIHCKLYISTYY